MSVRWQPGCVASPSNVQVVSGEEPVLSVGCPHQSDSINQHLASGKSYHSRVRSEKRDTPQILPVQTVGPRRGKCTDRRSDMCAFTRHIMYVNSQIQVKKTSLEGFFLCTENQLEGQSNK